MIIYWICEICLLNFSLNTSVSELCTYGFMILVYQLQNKIWNEIEMFCMSKRYSRFLLGFKQKVRHLKNKFSSLLLVEVTMFWI
jgi:hypothetical protein